MIVVQFRKTYLQRSTNICKLYASLDCITKHRKHCNRSCILVTKGWKIFGIKESSEKSIENRRDNDLIKNSIESNLQETISY